MKDFVAYFTQHVFVRYLISGGTAAATNLAIFFICNNILAIHYLYASAAAFLVAFVVSFTLHKFWTFKSHTEETHRQILKYLFVSLLALLANEGLMYIFVHIFHVLPFLSEIVVQAMLACCTFFISRYVIFKYKAEHSPVVQNSNTFQ